MLSAPELGERIADARKSRSWTQAQLAEGVGLARTTLVAIEKGARRPSNEELVRIAHQLGIALHDLLRETVSLGRPSPRFRAAGVAAHLDLSPAVAELTRLGRRYVELERLNGFSRVPAPLETVETWRASRGAGGVDPRSLGGDAARVVRNMLGLGDAPALALEEQLATEAGFRIFHLVLPEPVGALFLWSDALGACVAVNANHRMERRRWSLAHELGQFLRDREAGDVFLWDGPRSRLTSAELFADAFAQEFLLPQLGLRSRFHDRLRANGSRFSVADLIALAELYQAPFEATTRKLEALGHIRRGTFEKITARRLNHEAARRRLGAAGTTSSRPEKFPRRYVALAIQAYRNDELSEGDLAEYLDTDRVSAREIHLRETLHPLDGGQVFEAEPGTLVIDEVR